MDAPAPFDADALLAEAAAHTMRAIRVVSRVMEVEQAAIEVAAAWLPATHRAPASLAEAADAGRAADAITAATGPAAPRLALLSRAMDRLTRSLRYTIALKQRLQAGWPRPRAADDRPAMLRRQVARGVTSMIRHAAPGEENAEPAERLFRELYAPPRRPGPRRRPPHPAGRGDRPPHLPRLGPGRHRPPTPRRGTGRPSRQRVGITAPIPPSSWRKPSVRKHSHASTTPDRGNHPSIAPTAPAPATKRGRRLAVAPSIPPSASIGRRRASASAAQRRGPSALAPG